MELWREPPMEADRLQTPPAASAERPAPRELASSNTGDTASTSGPVGTDVLEPGPDRTSGPDRRAGPWLPSGPTTPPVGSPVPPRSVRRWRRWRLPLLYALALALLVTVLFVAVDTRARIHRTDTDLTSVRAQLRQTIGRAHRAQAGLVTVTAQSSAAASTLATETSELAAAEAQLESAEANVFTNGVSINSLDACLAGVEQALNQISLNDQSGAATTLDGVAAACRGAEPSP